MLNTKQIKTKQLGWPCKKADDQVRLKVICKQNLKIWKGCYKYLTHRLYGAGISSCD